MDGKQDKLTNPLVQADVVNSLASTVTNKPLSAAQGRALNVKIVGDTNYTWITHKTYCVDVQCAKRSGIASVIIAMNPKFTIPASNEWTILANIPPGHRPVVNTPFIFQYGNNSYPGFVYANGNIVIFTDANLTTDNVMFGSVSYLVAGF